MPLKAAQRQKEILVKPQCLTWYILVNMVYTGQIRMPHICLDRSDLEVTSSFHQHTVHISGLSGLERVLVPDT